MNDDIVMSVARAMQFTNVGVTYEYPGFISIPESSIGGDADSNRAWAVGLDHDGSWSGNLMMPDGTEAENSMGFSLNIPVNKDSGDAYYVALAIFSTLKRLQPAPKEHAS